MRLVGRVLAALDQAALGELVEDADQRDRLDFEDLGKPALMDALIIGEIGKRLPLRPRQPKVLARCSNRLRSRRATSCRRKPSVGLLVIYSFAG